MWLLPEGNQTPIQALAQVLVRMLARQELARQAMQFLAPVSWKGRTQTSAGLRTNEGWWPSLQYVLPCSLQLWRDMIDSLVSYSLWLRALLGLPEKEIIYLDMPEEQGQPLCSHIPLMIFPFPRPSWQGCLSHVYPSGGTSIRLILG